MKKSLLLGSLGGFALTAAAILVAFFKGGMYPFGWGTVSWCDMNQQVIPLFCDFRDILSGESSLFLNTANAGGMNFYAVFFFFLSSPFSFSVAFVDKADIPFLMNVLVILKLCLSGFFAAFSLMLLNRRLNPVFASALGCTYALCGYAMLFYQNIMWLDIMYLFPLVVLGSARLISKGRPLLLTVVLTLSVIFNFHLSFMVYLFVILFFGVFALLNRKADRKIYVNLGLSGGISLLASAFVWVPCLLQYFSSARTGGLIKGLKEVEFLAPYETTLTVLLQSGIILVAVIFFLPRLKGEKKETKLIFYTFLLSAIPLIIEPVNLMWHIGSYMAFPARYGFIPVFLGVMLAARILEKSEYTSRLKNKGIYLSVPIVVLGIFALCLSNENKGILSQYVGKLWGNKTALEGQIALAFCFSVAYLGIIWGIRKKVTSKGLAAVLMCCIVALEGISSVNIFMNTAKDSLGIYSYKSVIALKEKAEKDGFYRVNTQRKITDANMTGAAGFASLGHYTSLNSESYMKAARKLGYSGYWMETGNWGGSILSDALLSVGYTVFSKNGSYYLSENPYYLGLGIRAKGEIPETLEKTDRLASTGKAFGTLLGCENPVTEYKPKKQEDCQIASLENECLITVENSGIVEYSVNVTAPTTLYFDCYNGFSNNLVEDINHSFAVYVEGELLTEAYPTQTNNGLLRIGSFRDKQVNITLKVLKDVSCTSFGLFGVDEGMVSKAVKESESLNLSQKGGSIIGDAQKGSYFIGIPKSDGLRITLNGKKIHYKSAFDGFVAVTLPTSGELKISIIPNGLYIGIVFNLMGILICAVTLFKHKKRSVLDTEPVKNVTYGMFLGVAVTTVLSVYIIPIILSLSDFKL